ncbi:hypothetical protein DFH28DRAFT_1081147 [Melampsora americana]|nr:hypothetical protein DFH28DRAFT_1081147 [Melampsora americana]
MSERDFPMQGIHTNNFTESYHRVLKYNFLSRHTLRRPDDTIQVLVDVSESDFRQSVITTTLGFRPQRTTKYQNVSKGLAESYSDSDLIDLGVSINKLAGDNWSMSSFMRPLAFMYQLNTTPPKHGCVGYVNNCTCQHYIKNKSACKHIYVLARQTGFKILETDPEIDDGYSPFQPRQTVEPFNIVVCTLTNIHIDSPPSSPRLNPYRSSSGMAQTPSTTGNNQSVASPPSGACNHTHQPETANQCITSRDLPQLRSPDQSHWRTESTHLTTGRTDPSSDSYMSRLLYDPFKLQSTPPLRGPAPYPPSPLNAQLTGQHGYHPVHNFSFDIPLTSPLWSFSTTQPPEQLPNLQHQLSYRYNLSPEEAAHSVPAAPLPTQTPYYLDSRSLQHHLQPRCRQPAGQHSLRLVPVSLPQTPSSPPELQPIALILHLVKSITKHLSIRKSFYASSRSLVHSARVSLIRAAIYSHRHNQIHASNASTNATTSGIIGSTSSQPMESTNTNQSIDQGPSVLTELEVEAMNAAELQFYKKRDDLAELLKTLRTIHAEAPFHDEAGTLNRHSPTLIADMRQEAVTFLATLRAFNSTNQTSKQHRY